MTDRAVSSTLRLYSSIEHKPFQAASSDEGDYKSAGKGTHFEVHKGREGGDKSKLHFLRGNTSPFFSFLHLSIRSHCQGVVAFLSIFASTRQGLHIGHLQSLHFFLGLSWPLAAAPPFPTFT